MDPYVGEIRIFAGNYPPEGWMFCLGQELPINAYQVLYAVIGSIYGGNGSSTFKLPDMQGRLPMHWGQGTGLTTRTIGESDGVESITLAPQQLAAHNHFINASDGDGSQSSPESNFPSALIDPSSGSDMNLFSQTGNTMLNNSAVSFIGGNQAHTNLQPFLCLSFIIATTGNYPPRPQP